MRNQLIIGLGAFLGACASHPSEPARQPIGTAADYEASAPEARSVDQPERAASTTDSTAQSPERREAPRADAPPTSSAPRTWSTDSNLGTVGQGDEAPAPARNASRPDADDTRVNERDKSGATLTPTDQGSGDADMKLTQQIRKAVMADGSLSFTAKNVKIIAVDGKVTLRGPVKTDAERQSIVNAARNVAGANNVDDQLEVKK